MDSFVFAAVLFAAACHAGWNAVIKRGLDPLATTVLISIGAAIVVGRLPAGRRLAGCRGMAVVRGVRADPSVLFRRLDRGYRAGDMGQVYPIARGSAPLMTATATTLFVGERLGFAGWCGIVLLVAGVVLLSLRGGRDLGAARSQGGRLRLVYRGHDLRLFRGGRVGRAPCRQRQRLFGRAVRRKRAGHADLCVGPRRTGGGAGDGAPLGHRARRRHVAGSAPTASRSGR